MRREGGREGERERGRKRERKKEGERNRGDGRWKVPIAARRQIRILCRTSSKS
jgi:hypothetical protein